MPRPLPSRRRYSRIIIQTSATTETSMATKTGNLTLDLSSSSAARPVNPSRPPASERDWMTRAVNSLLPISTLLLDCARNGSSGKTFLVESTLPCRESSTRLQKAGIAVPGAYWTLSVSEYRRDAVDYSLSDILETGEVQQRYYLTPKAAQGYLNRCTDPTKMPAELRAALIACTRRG